MMTSVDHERAIELNQSRSRLARVGDELARLYADIDSRKTEDDQHDVLEVIHRRIAYLLIATGFHLIRRAEKRHDTDQET